MIVGRKTARRVRAVEQGMAVVTAVAAAVILGSVSYLMLGALLIALGVQL